MSIPSYISQKGDAVYYTGQGEFRFYVPEFYYDRRFAIADGEYTKLLGVVTYTTKISEKDDPIKKIRNFFYPSMFITKPGSVEKVRNLKISDSSKPMDYRVLKYTNNGEDQIITSVYTAEDISNVEDLNRMFINTGNIPNTIRYDELQNYFDEAIKLNGNKYPITKQMFGIIISELCRDPNDVSKPFRLSSAINKDMTSFISISVKDIPKYVSPFTAIISENWNEAIMYSIMNSEDGKTAYTPLEKVMMGK